MTDTLLLTATEAAVILRLSVDTIRDMANQRLTTQELAVPWYRA